MKYEVKKNILIIGSFGVGKTTIGRKLAKELKMQFYDTDQIIAARSGVNLDWIFDVEGEEGFQQREEQLLEELLQLQNAQNAVIATGGSVVFSKKNVALLSAANSEIIHLYTTLDNQIKRVLRNRYNRPALRVEDLAKYLHGIRKDSDPLYEAIADVKFSTRNQSISLILQQMMNYLIKSNIINET